MTDVRLLVKLGGASYIIPVVSTRVAAGDGQSLS